MNLKKYFNKNYFIQNIKKSKGLLAFIFGVVPLINILFLIIMLTNKQFFIDFAEISIITYLGLFILPTILALSLFGFVFKRRSVDFTLSSPISRKSIFISNIIGGIFLIIIAILINGLIFGAFGLFTEIVIPFSLILDYILYFIVAYIFVFIATALAIAISGNLVTSIVILMLIICAYPAMYLIKYEITSDLNGHNYIKCESDYCLSDNYFCNDDDLCMLHLIDNEYSVNVVKEGNPTFVAPINFITGFKFNGKSIIKMTILSIIYVVLGYFIFIKRKMENNETDFKLDFLHYLFKIITIIPICFVTFLVIKEGEILGFICSFVAVVIYSVIYDLILRREIYKLKRSTIIISIAFLVVNLGYYMIDSCVAKSYVLDNITSIKFENANNNTFTIEDYDAIEKIKKKLIVREFSEYEYTVTVIIKNNNDTFSSYIGLNKEEYIKLNDYFNNNSDNNYRNFPYDKINYIAYENERVPVTKELKEIFREVKQLDKINSLNQDMLYIDLYTYDDHKYKVISLPINVTKRVEEYFLRKINGGFIGNIKKGEDLYLHLIGNYEEYLDTFDNFVFDYVISKNIDKFIKYISDHAYDKIEDPLIISTYRRFDYNYIIGDAKSFIKEFRSYQENLKNDLEYQKFIKEYEDSHDS